MFLWFAFLTRIFSLFNCLFLSYTLCDILFDFHGDHEVDYDAFVVGTKLVCIFVTSVGLNNMLDIYSSFSTWYCLVARSSWCMVDLESSEERSRDCLS